MMKSLDLTQAEIRKVKAVLLENKIKKEKRVRITKFKNLYIRQLAEKDNHSNSNLMYGICALTNRRVKVHITKNYINSCYRVGKRDNNPRARA